MDRYHEESEKAGWPDRLNRGEWKYGWDGEKRRGVAVVRGVHVLSDGPGAKQELARIKHGIESHLESSAAKTGTKARIGVFLFTLLMITREGMETALLMGTLFFQEAGVNILVGAAGGTLCAAFVAWLWSRYGHRINLGLFFQVTSIFLVLFAVQLLIYSFHEATEANVLPIDNQYWHIATEPYGPEGEYGAILTYALVLVPAVWIIWSMFSGKRKVAPALSAKSGSRGKIQLRWYHGRIASSCNQRHSVLPLMEATRPL